MALEIKRVFSINPWDLTRYQFVEHWNYAQETRRDNSQADDMYRQEKRAAIISKSKEQKVKDGIDISDTESKNKNKMTPEQKALVSHLWGSKPKKTLDKE